MSSLSPARSTVRTRASMPPTYPGGHRCEGDSIGFQTTEVKPSTSMQQDQKQFPKGTYLTHHEFITVVVTCQVGEDAGSTCHNINVITAQQLDQSPQKTLHSLLERSQVGLGKADG